MVYNDIMYNGNRNRLNQFLNTYSDIGDENDCWIWKGPIDKKLGYGRTSFLGKPMTAHRVVYILAYGDYPKFIEGMRTCIRHLCSNRLCVNPKHIALGTYSDNTRDASMAGRGTKMTIDKLTLAVKLRREGLTYGKIGKILELGEAVVSMSLRGKTYYCREMLKKIANH